MEMRDGFMRPPRNRGGLMWPPVVPFRGRNMIGMDRMRLPHIRPGMMRGGPPVPPFVGRGMTPPHARPRGAVMLPRPPIHPPGPMGPLGPRGMPPRAVLPPRALGIDAGNPNDSVQIPINGAAKEPLKNAKDGNVPKNISGPVSNQMGSRVVNRNIKVPIRVKGNQNAGQSLIQNIHSSHHPQPPIPQNSGMNPPHIPKHQIQSQMNVGVHQQAQPHPMQHQPSLRGGRNGMNPRNRGAPGLGRGGLMNVPPLGIGRGNVMINRGGPPNLAPRGGPHGRGNLMGGHPPPQASYAPAPPPPQAYPIPPPGLGPQGPMKRGGPPMGMPPPMPPKRIRYDPSLSANGYGQYQQPPPPQTPYSSYDAPPPADMYSNVMPPPPLNSSQAQNYNSPDYNYSSGPQNSSHSGNTQYSPYNNDSGYSYSGGSSSYDPSVEYHPSSNNPNSGVEPYGYKGGPADSYGVYSNSGYSNSQAGYDDYSYGDSSGYGAPMQDSSYGQPLGTYNNYSY